VRSRLQAREALGVPLNATPHPGLSLADVLEARRTIRGHLAPTPLYEHRSLSALAGTRILVKHENHLPTGAFKVRGGVNLVGQLATADRERGLIAASTGNHGQSIAFAAGIFGVRAIICAPENPNPTKLAGMRALGAEVVEHGRDYDEAREFCEALAAEHGYRYVHSGNEPLLIAGVGTHTLEILEQSPEVNTIVVPIGGGSGAAGACIVAKAVDPRIQIIGVQAAAAPSAYRSWQARALISDEMNTAAEGLSTRVPFELPQSILWQLLDDFVLVSEEEITDATRLMIEHTRNLVEGAAASTLAAILRLGPALRDKTVALICTGGNVSPAQLASLFPPRDVDQPGSG
jgi:threonine dehydratase